MTDREKAILILKELWRYEHVEYEDCEVRKALDMAIEALEQEPILDKIRAEIEQAADKQLQIAMGVTNSRERYAHIQMESAYRHSLNIIDKYRGEG